MQGLKQKYYADLQSKYTIKMVTVILNLKGIGF